MYQSTLKQFIAQLLMAILLFGSIVEGVTAQQIKSDDVDLNGNPIGESLTSCRRARSRGELLTAHGKLHSSGPIRRDLE
jgi:hypothetical protein